MSDFWPSGLDIADTDSPLDILHMAQKEWTEQSGGLVTLVVQEAQTTNGNHLLVVHAKHVPSHRTVTLFSVVHRAGAPYPAKIQPRDNELPDILKKSYYRAGIGDFAAGLALSPGRQVTNKWVCDTPSEFRSELSDVLNLGMVKSEVLSLISGGESSSRTGEEAEGRSEKAEGEPNEAGS